MDFIAITSFFQQAVKKGVFLNIIMLTAGAAYAEAASEPDWVPQLLGMQATIIYQNMPAFPSPYEGPQSLRFERGEGQGHTETYGVYLGSRLVSFTEVDRHPSAGVQVSGIHWGRTDDRLGIAYVWHGLSPEHRDYLAAGGSGFLLGDGRLNYGLEQILETYYRVQLGRYAQLSPDFQYMQNPGYNRDRGPTEVYSLRAHLSY